VREQQHQRERKAMRDAFQRESVLALQSAVTDLIGSAYAELDRLLDEFRETAEWNARQWETPTAVGWSTALLRLESSRARVFDEEMRSLADELRTIAGKSVWAKDLESAKEASRHLEPLLGRFNVAVTAVLPNLYRSTTARSLRYDQVHSIRHERMARAKGVALAHRFAAQQLSDLIAA
jgi:hypothetical protein